MFSNPSFPDPVPCCIPQHMCRMYIKLAINYKILSTHFNRSMPRYTADYLLSSTQSYYLLPSCIVEANRSHQSKFQACRPSGLSSGKHYKLLPPWLLSICFMVLEHCTLVPLIINYRIRRDLMKILTFKWPRILWLWENTYFSLLTDAAEITAKQPHIEHRYTPMLHTLHVHMNTYSVLLQIHLSLYDQKKNNWWTVQKLQHFAMQLSGILM